MSVASKNPFALLNEESDAVDAKPSANKNAPSAATSNRTQNNRGGGNRGRGSGPRGGRYYARGGGKTATTETTEADDGRENTGARFHGGENKEKRGRGRGRGRPYTDRHSRTDIVDSEKQVSAGWGADTGDAELNAETAGEADAQAEAAGAGTEDAEAEKRPVEEEDKTLTLDEYLAQKANSSLSGLVGSVGGRQANEGDDSLFDDANRVIKEDEEYYVGKTRSGPKVRAERKEKVTIEIDGQFSDSRERGRGGRGGRGGPRGRGDRGDRGDRGNRGDRGGPRRGRGGRYGEGEVNVDDENAFPTLGA